MEFDVSKVYTAINADELPVGSKCIFAETLKDLKDKVLSNDDCSTYTLKAIGDEDSKDRFKDFSCTWTLAYLVELPEEKVIKPFKTIEEAREAITARGGFLKNKDTGYTYLVTGYSRNDKIAGLEIFVADSWRSLERIAEDFVFADDGCPCGIVED